MSIQQYSRLRLVQAISQLPVNDSVTSQVSTGRVWGWRDSRDAPLIIQLPSGVHFACGGLSANQRMSAMAAGAIGLNVDFYHRGFDIQGKPIRPAFKTLKIDTGASVLTLGCDQ